MATEFNNDEVIAKAWAEYNAYIEKTYGKIPTISEYFEVKEGN
jgi:hypothetical protein